MCEHSFYLVDRTVDGKYLHTGLCKHCNKSAREIELENQLAAANARIAELELDKTILLEILARQRVIISANVCCGCPDDKHGDNLQLCKDCEVLKLRNYEEKYFLDYCENQSDKRDLLDSVERAERAEAQAYEWYLRHAWFGVEADNYCDELAEKCSDIMKQSQYDAWKAEQSEGKVKRLIKKITFNTPRLDNFGDNEYLLSIDENDHIPAAPCVCYKLEQTEAQAAAMRIRFEQYVRDNCKLIRHSVADGIGYPDDVDGKCGGYCQNYDEPHETCQTCVAYAYPDESDEEPDAGSALLARMERMRTALREIRKCVTTCNTPNETVYAMDKLAAEALDGRDGKPGANKT